MNLKLNLVKDNLTQILLQDNSDASAGVSRVILDFVTPVKKRIELNGRTEIKANNFVNPLVNAFLAIQSTEFGSKEFAPGIYEVEYNVHYPFREELFGSIGDNMLHGIQMLNILGDADWLYISGVYYQVVRQYSTQDYLFLHKPLATSEAVGELCYRNRIYLPVVEKYRASIFSQFEELTSETASLEHLRNLMSATFGIFGLIGNTRKGRVDMATEQQSFIERQLQWEKKPTPYKKG